MNEQIPIKDMWERSREGDPTEAGRILSTFPDFLEVQRRLKMEEIEDNEEERSRAYEEVTEFQFLITHYLLEQKSDPRAAKDMWNALAKIAREKGEGPNFPALQRGVATQVATHRIFEALGFRPRISHPDEDAFKKIDLWSDDTHAVQVKGSADTNEVGVFETDRVSPASVRVMSKDGTREKLFDSDFRSLKANVSAFGKDTKGYFIVIPASMIDKETGAPSPELVETVKNKISV